MQELINIEERREIWIALSLFYLDTELQDNDFKYIASIIVKSPYSLDKVKKINKYEVFPILQHNLLSMVGVWEGFDEKWLVDEIALSLKKKTKIGALAIDFFYLIFKWMCNDYWIKFESAYHEIKREGRVVRYSLCCPLFISVYPSIRISNAVKLRKKFNV